MKDLSIKKLYYSISEVSRITSIEQYVLRYWETEFEQLKPQKNRAGNRVYTNKDIQLILYIKQLLREKKYTIEGAKKILENYSGEQNSEIKFETHEEEPVVKEVKSRRSLTKKDLEEIKEVLVLLLKKL